MIYFENSRIWRGYFENGKSDDISTRSQPEIRSSARCKSSAIDISDLTVLQLQQARKIPSLWYWHGSLSNERFARRRKVGINYHILIPKIWTISNDCNRVVALYRNNKWIAAFLVTYLLAQVAATMWAFLFPGAGSEFDRKWNVDCDFLMIWLQHYRCLMWNSIFIKVRIH